MSKGLFLIHDGSHKREAGTNFKKEERIKRFLHLAFILIEKVISGFRFFILLFTFLSYLLKANTTSELLLRLFLHLLFYFRRGTKETENR